jgi:hypothetical protein
MQKRRRKALGKASRAISVKPISSANKAQAIYGKSDTDPDLHHTTQSAQAPTGRGRRLTAAMAGGGAYKGYTIPQNKRWHTVAGKGLCAVMWYALPPFPLLFCLPAAPSVESWGGFPSFDSTNACPLTHLWCCFSYGTRSVISVRFGDLELDLLIALRSREGHVGLFLEGVPCKLIKWRNVLPPTVCVANRRPASIVDQHITALPLYECLLIIFTSQFEHDMTGKKTLSPFTHID